MQMPEPSGRRSLNAEDAKIQRFLGRVNRVNVASIWQSLRHSLKPIRLVESSFSRYLARVTLVIKKKKKKIDDNKGSSGRRSFAHGS